MAPPIRLLTFTTLYPDSTRPTHGIFVENRLRHLLQGGRVISRVVAPVPWFPSSNEMFGAYGKSAGVPSHEVHNGIDVSHPRYPLIPKVGMTAAPWLMAAALKPLLSRIARSGYDFDILDAHYFYPDCVAAAILARALRKPLVATARGSDINLIAKYRLPCRMIRWAADRSAAVITVCQALKDRLIGLGVPGQKITVLRNGVDLAMFRPPVDKSALRRELGIRGKLLLSVGNLVELKGHNLAIQALAAMQDVQLWIIGEGPEQHRLQKLARSLGLDNRVRLLGRIPHQELPRFYGAADCLVLASSREGWPNVLLESMACGTPVVATLVSGTQEIITTADAGVLIGDRSPDAIAWGVNQLFANYPSQPRTRRHAEQFSWDATTRGQESVFDQILGASRL